MVKSKIGALVSVLGLSPRKWDQNGVIKNIKI